MKMEALDNKITKRVYDLANKTPNDMQESEKTAYGNEWHTNQDRNENLENNRGQAYSLILGQCTQLLQDKMNQDTA